MSDSLFELLKAHIPAEPTGQPVISSSDSVASKYLARISRLDLDALQNSEPQALAQSSHSNILAIQGLSSRSAKSLISSLDHLANLTETLPTVTKAAHTIRDGVTTLDREAVQFSEKYSRSSDTPNPVLERRKRALLLARNGERVADILELPTLLHSTVHSAAAAADAAANGTSSNNALSTTTTYNAALDLHAHIKRLTALHPESPLIHHIKADAAHAMRGMTAGLVQTLRGPNLKLAGGMRTIGWLRRIAPALLASTQRANSPHVANAGSSEEEGSLGALFLVSRLANLINTLEALEPLRDLADQETSARTATEGTPTGHQTERYLKRFVELFREQSFGIISMFRSIFPSEDEEVDKPDVDLDFDKLGLGNEAHGTARRSKLEIQPSAISTFPLHLISNLFLPTLRQYLPNISDRSARDSLLTQVLYCAGSLGRLGGDFSLLLLDLFDDQVTAASDEEDDHTDGSSIQAWVEVMEKHRVQAARLESLASNGAAIPADNKTRTKSALPTHQRKTEVTG